MRGTDRWHRFAEVADVAYHGAAAAGCSPGLEVTEFYDPPDTNDPQAMHLAVVVVDAETGAVTLRAFYAADDVRRVINPMIVEGQVHGGLAQGIGQALTERIVYDPSGPAPDRELPRLRHAAGGRSSRVPHGLHRHASAEQSARRQGRKRERNHRRARGDRQRGDRRAVASRRARHRFADHVRDRLARARAARSTPRCGGEERRMNDKPADVAARIADELAACGVKLVASLPDNWLTGVIDAVDRDERFRAYPGQPGGSAIGLLPAPIWAPWAPRR